MADVVTLALCGVVGRPRYRPVVVGCSLFASVLFLCSAPDDLLCSGVETMFRLLSVALALCATRLWPGTGPGPFEAFGKLSLMRGGRHASMAVRARAVRAR